MFGALRAQGIRQITRYAGVLLFRGFQWDSGTARVHSGEIGFECARVAAADQNNIAGKSGIQECAGAFLSERV